MPMTQLRLEQTAWDKWFGELELGGISARRIPVHGGSMAEVLWKMVTEAGQAEELVRVIAAWNNDEPELEEPELEEPELGESAASLVEMIAPAATEASVPTMASVPTLATLANLQAAAKAGKK